jgi:hypothetical protein
MKQAAISNRFRAALLDDRPGSDSRLLSMVFKTTTQPAMHPLRSLYSVSESHHFSISEHAIHRLGVPNAKVPQDQPLRFKNNHDFDWIS